MRWRLPAIGRKWLLIPPLLMGIAAAAVLIARRQPAEREPAKEMVRPARVIRVAARDVIAVDKPYAQAVPGERPPLVRGMFCEVELRGSVQRGRIVSPPHWIGSISDSRLASRQAKTWFRRLMFS